MFGNKNMKDIKKDIGVVAIFALSLAVITYFLMVLRVFNQFGLL
jgi:hypothetical protein